MPRLEFGEGWKSYGFPQHPSYAAAVLGQVFCHCEFERIERALRRVDIEMALCTNSKGSSVELARHDSRVNMYGHDYRRSLVGTNGAASEETPKQ